MRRFLCAHATANITPTRWLAGLLHLPHVQAIPHGLDFPQVETRPIELSSRPVLVFLGRLVTTKGVHVLLKAAKLLRAQNRSFELVIIGDGPEREALEEFVRDAQLGGQVKFAGRLSETQVNVALARASLAVIPSLGGEVFGLVVAEAMSRGLPVVASDLGAFREVLGDAGLVFRTGGPEDLAAVLSRVLDDSALAADVGCRAHHRALDLFNRSRMVEEHVHVYCKSVHG